MLHTDLLMDLANPLLCCALDFDIQHRPICPGMSPELFISTFVALNYQVSQNTLKNMFRKSQRTLHA